MTLSDGNNKITDTIIPTTSSTYLEKNRFILSESKTTTTSFLAGPLFLFSPDYTCTVTNFYKVKASISLYLFDGNSTAENGTWNIEGIVTGESSLTFTSSSGTEILGSDNIDEYVSIDEPSDIVLSISSGKIILDLSLQKALLTTSTALAKCIADIEIISLV